MIIKEGTQVKILNCSTDDSLKELEKLFKTNVISKESIKTAHIKYDSSKGIGTYGSHSYYPLTFAVDDLTIMVSCVSIGNDGEGPKGTIKALQIAGFAVTEETERVIFTYKKTDRYIFKKDF